ncbi:MAG TPA: hypothetical protein VNL16_15275 [Chloroflexota bacterium]|nr:hypothetical protein [Chloroflexota bacterium]
MEGTPHYLHAGFILISTSNLVVIALLLIVFAAAVWLRLPGGHPSPTVDDTGDVPPEQEVTR